MLRPCNSGLKRAIETLSYVLNAALGDEDKKRDSLRRQRSLLYSCNTDARLKSTIYAMSYRPPADPRGVRSWLDAGIAAHQAGDLDRAVSMYRQALALAPDNGPALNLLGSGLLQAGEPVEAVEYLERAANRQRDNAELLANLAQCYLALQRHDKAFETFRRASRLDPKASQFQVGAAAALALQGKLADAEAILQRLTTRFPNAPLVWFNLGNVLRDLQHPDRAILAYRKALELEPTLVDALNNLGSVLHSRQRFAEAESAYRQCLELAPDHLLARYNLASAIMDLGRFAEAEAVCRELVTRAPNVAEGHTILGAAVGHQGRLVETLGHYARAAQLTPDAPKVAEVYAAALMETGSTAEGLRWFARVLARDPLAPGPRQLLGTMLLGRGSIHDGWRDYTVRPAALRFRQKYAHLSLTRELPRNLSGQCVCVLREQGLGDEIFFLRYAPAIAARGGRMIYRASKKIAPLLSRARFIEALVDESAPFPPADAYVLVGDVAHALEALPLSALDERAPPYAAAISDFRSRISVYWPPVPPSITLEPLAETIARMRERLEAIGPPPYLGVTWRAGTMPEEQTSVTWVLYKTIPIAALAHSMKGTEGTVLALQRQPGPGEIDAFSAALGRPVHDLTALNDDLEGMLALLTLLDDYVTVSNTNVHLRASVGRTARVLVPAPPEWRWMYTGRSTPWFPGSVVYRQSLQGDWTPALAELKRDVEMNYGVMQSSNSR
jgi:tetratricopeptide (TPR) repeat protein